MEIESISDDGVLPERKVEIRVRKDGRKDKIIVEKSAAEGLPKGWIKKVVIRNRTGHKSRRDPYFFDPKSEYVFQSFKDALRYVESGVIGNHARKLKESNHEDDDDTGNGKPLLLLDSVEKKSSDDLLEKEKEMNTYDRNIKRRSLPSSDEDSNSCKLSSDLGKKEDATDSTKKQPISSNDNDKTMAYKYTISKRVTRSQAKARKNDDDSDSERKDLFCSSNAKPEEHTVKSKLSSASSQDPEQESVMKEKSQDCIERSVLNVIGSRITRSKSKLKKNDDNHDRKEKKEVNNSVPRRASKRLAGIALDPVPELKKRTSAQRVPALVRSDDSTVEKCMQPELQVNPTTSGCEKTDTTLNQEVAKSYNDHSSPKSDAATSNCLSTEMAVEIKKRGKSVDRSPSDDKKIIETPLVTAEKASEGNCVGESSMNDCNKQMGEEMSPVSPLSCQSSVTKCENSSSRTLGESLRLNPESKLTSLQVNEISLVSDKNEHPSKLGKDFSITPSSNFAVVKGSCSNVIENNTNSFSEPPAFDLTLADLWKDPCIAFAIKILTGEPLHLPNNAAVSSDTKNCKMVNNPPKQKGISFSPEMPENVNMGVEKPGFSSELTSEYIWKDPCIDFAIKTLTDAIPIRLDEPKSHTKSERPKGTTLQAPESRESGFDYLLHQHNMKSKTVSGGVFMGKTGDKTS